MVQIKHKISFNILAGFRSIDLIIRVQVRWNPVAEQSYKAHLKQTTYLKFLIAY